MEPKGELIIVENGAVVPGEIRNMNDRIQSALIKASTKEERLVMELEAAILVRHTKLQTAIDRLNRMNDELEKDLAGQLSEETK